MTVLTLLQSLVIAALVPLATPHDLPHSTAGNTGRRDAQVWGGLCQTPFGVCPLIDQNGQAYQAPVGSTCFCGSDAGTVVQ